MCMWSVTGIGRSSDPVRLQESGGFRRTEIHRIEELARKNQALLLRTWNEFFHT